MKKVQASCLGAFIALASGAASAALDRTGDFALLDSDGEFGIGTRITRGAFDQSISVDVKNVY